MEVHDALFLHETPDKFYVEANGNSNEVLFIDRLTQEVGLDSSLQGVPASARTRPINGIIGIIHLPAGHYLVVITKASKVARINGQDVWRVEATEMISFPRTQLHLNEERSADNAVYVSMIDKVLSTPYLYFSYAYDVTHTLQRLHNTMPEFLQMPLHERADERFVWNRHLIRDLATQPELARFVLPIMHGFVETKHCSIGRHVFTYTLVSRRCCYRAGTRFFMRGADQEGQVANYVETEQIIEYQGDKCSFVQTRGSIPIVWSQLPNIKYKPKPEVVTGANHLESLSKHFDTQVLHYGKQVVINLIDQKGAEGRLEKAFADVINSFGSPFVKYEAFDFHHECRKMRYDRLAVLLDRVSAEQDEFTYCLLKKDGTALRQQDGVFRTNCIDCLDRTNVVQSLLARRNLQQVFTQVGILSDGQRVEDQVAFEQTFKEIWADHADVISTQYSGTGALKTDFTRTGKRTKAGLLRDGINSAVRYYKNNLADGFRQDAIDLFLGNYNVDDTEGSLRPSPLRTEKDWKQAMVPVVWLLAIAMFSVTVLLPSEYTTESLLYMLFWGSMVGATSTFIVKNGPEFVDWPKLVNRYPSHGTLTSRVFSTIGSKLP